MHLVVRCQYEESDYRKTNVNTALNFVNDPENLQMYVTLLRTLILNFYVLKRFFHVNRI